MGRDVEWSRNRGEMIAACRTSSSTPSAFAPGCHHPNGRFPAAAMAGMSVVDALLIGSMRSVARCRCDVS
jgi:hypothetical protein